MTAATDHTIRPHQEGTKRNSTQLNSTQLHREPNRQRNHTQEDDTLTPPALLNLASGLQVFSPRSGGVDGRCILPSVHFLAPAAAAASAASFAAASFSAAFRACFSLIACASLNHKTVLTRERERREGRRKCYKS